ncbi:MAG TPA: hypothetical protein VK509_19350 [Polyangiales bacterium]|nr:hypothetical protein [Polyangiales bacterium]
MLPAFPPSRSISVSSTLCLVLVLAGCSQTDVVAIDEALCLHRGDCTGDGGCAARSCESAASDGDNPPVQVGDGCSDVDPSAQSFRFALCSCSDYVSEAPLIVAGEGGANARAASVGVNGSLNLGAGASIDGSLQVTGMISTGDGPVVDATGIVLEAANTACNCEPENLLDVAALVAAARAANDDAAQGLEPDALDGFSSMQTLTVSSGKLYLTRIAGSAPLALQVDGPVQLYVDANVELDSTLAIALAADARLDLFIAGNVRARALTLGGADTAGRLRIYVGGDGTINLEDPSLIGGALYAPTAELVTRGTLEAFGPLFVRRAAPGEELRVHYDVASATPVTCE